jgi:hypothetical protein
MTGQESSPLKRLVLVIVTIAVAASCLAGILFASVEQPKMNDVPAPENQLDPCSQKCIDEWFAAELMCAGNQACLDRVLEEARACEAKCPHYPPR